MTNPIDPISYNAGIEAARTWLRAQANAEGKLLAEHRGGNADKRDAFAEAHNALRSLHRTEPQTAPDNVFARMADEMPAVLPADVSEQVNFRTASEIERSRLSNDKAHIPTGYSAPLDTRSSVERRSKEAAPADAERLALADGALLDRLKTEAQLAKNGGHPILERSFNLAIDEIKKLREAAKGQLVVINTAIAERQRTERNRDMWKGQCERQAEKLTALRAGGWREDMENAPDDCIVYQPEHAVGRSVLPDRICLKKDAGYHRKSSHWQPLPSAPKNTDKVEG